MDINKIRYFEANNRMRTNVFFCDEKDEITPLKMCSAKTKTEYPLINMFYYNKDYTYIKDFNKLFNCEKHQRVCPCCCDFRTGANGAKALERHRSYCISGQKVDMPKSGENTLKFNQHKNLTPT